MQLENASATGPFTYAAFGMSVVSDFPLAELTPTPLPTDPANTLFVRRGLVPEAWDHSQVDPYFRFCDGGDILRWSAVGGFHLRGEREIVVEPAAGVDLHLVGFPLLGPVLALHLHRRGLLVLHASAVEVEGNALVLLGDKGAGKSTLAGALVAAGHRLLTDDLLVLSQPDANGARRVEAAAGQLKLYPDSRGAMNLRDSRVIEADLHPAVTKRQHRLGQSFTPQSAPLGALLTLDRGTDGPLIETFEPGEALQALVRFSYPVRFGDEGLRPDGRRALFSHCADLAARYPVGRLSALSGLEHLGRTIETVETFMRMHAGAR